MSEKQIQQKDEIQWSVCCINREPDAESTNWQNKSGQFEYNTASTLSCTTDAVKILKLP